MLNIRIILIALLETCAELLMIMILILMLLIQWLHQDIIRTKKILIPASLIFQEHLVVQTLQVALVVLVVAAAVAAEPNSVWLISKAIHPMYMVLRLVVMESIHLVI